MKTEDISTLSGMELRKALCEALDICHRYMVTHDEQQADGRDPCALCGVPRHSHDNGLPAYESDATLSEELLDRVCREKGWTWDLGLYGSVYKCTLGQGLPNPIAVAFGSTPSEARCWAIVMALRSK